MAGAGVRPKPPVGATVVHVDYPILNALILGQGQGKENYFVMAMYLDTRLILAWCTTACKQSHDATKLPKAAMAKAGKPYPILITDGSAGYHTAFKKVFGSLKGLNESAVM